MPDSVALRAELTDSRLYFEIVRWHIAQERDVGAGVQRAVASIREHYPHASLNALLLTPETLVAVHASSNAENPLRTRPEAELPPGHHRSYFQMFYRRTPGGGTIVSSSGMDVSGWTPLPVETILMVDVRTGEHFLRDMPTAYP